MNNGWKEIACLMMLYLPVSILLQLTKQENALKKLPITLNWTKIHWGPYGRFTVMSNQLP